MQIRDATKDDLAAMVGLMHALIDELGTDEPAHVVKARVDSDLQRAVANADTALFVIDHPRSTSDLAAFARVDILRHDPLFRLRTQNMCGYVDQIFVRSQWRKRGLGTQLLNACEAWLKEAGVAYVQLHAAEHAGPFYRQQGYGACRQMMKRLI